MLSFVHIRRVINKKVYLDHWPLSFLVLEREPGPCEYLAKAVPLTELPPHVDRDMYVHSQLFIAQNITL